MRASRPIGPAGAIALLLLLVVLAVGLLYAYRAQTPAMKEIALSEAIARVERGEVSSVVVSGDTASLELRDGQRYNARMPDRDESLARAVNERNRADPGHAVALKYEQSGPFPGAAFSVVLSLVPLLFLLALILLAASAFTRARSPDRYEQLARLADLRDRGAITEEEFQREKRRILS